MIALLVALAAVAVPGLALAYIGPGAGFAAGSSLLTLLASVAAAVLSLCAAPVRLLLRAHRRRKAARQARVKRLIVLGFDGLDPGLTERWMAEGRLPHFAEIARRGGFQRLATTYPAISPVAWSSFMTGVEPARHRIFDFVHRDRDTYGPRLSTGEVTPGRTLRLGPVSIPFGAPIVRGVRRSRAVWSLLGEHGVRSLVLRVPLSFPPERVAGALLAGMGIPDLRGTQGSFTYYTTDPAKLRDSAAVARSSGEWRLLRRDGRRLRGELSGPSTAAGCSPLSFELCDGERDGALALRIGRRRHVLRADEYSPWLPLAFRRSTGGRVHAIARFLVTRHQAELALYVTPLQIDPAHPALPISFPWYYSRYLAARIGEFATLGLAEDTSALDEGVIDASAFLEQVEKHRAEREAMLENALEVSRDGLIVCVFDDTDRVQHMFFRQLEEEEQQPPEPGDARPRHVIRNAYVRADAVVGRVLARMRPGDQLLVLSDHGFAPFRRGVDLNAWLRREGLLHLRANPKGGDWLEDVDWTRTRAYGFGLAGIYINRVGRERQGCVQPGAETQSVKRWIIERLSGLRDEARDTVAINQVFDSAEVCGDGLYGDEGPDLIVGYARGYRASWDGASGRTTDEVFCDNDRHWSGDHCVDPRLVPGVLFSSGPLAMPDPRITDLAPTILELLGVPVPVHMTGRSLAPTPGTGA